MKLSSLFSTNIHFIWYRPKYVISALLFTGILSSCANLPGLSAQKYTNPVVEQRADPWVYRDGEGQYYFIGTAPEFDRIEIRKAQSLNSLQNATPEVIWRKHEDGPMSGPIWAPELHRVDGIWYIYFAAGAASGPHPQIRMFVLSNPADDPTTGQWREEGRIQTQRDSFSLDATTFEHRGTRYLIWAQKDPEEKYNSALYIAKMSSPTTIVGPEILLTEPTLPWEVIGYKVNEGPAVIIRHGRVFVTYSASATDHNYAVGLLWADNEADLLDPSSWQKSPIPVFSTNEEVKRFGPGHNSFTVAEDGMTDVLIYHARDYREIQGNPLADPNRDARARILTWTKKGWPNFDQNRGD